MSSAIRILHLEDDPADARLIREQLRRAGLDVIITVVTGREAFEAALAKSEFDVVLSDLKMPDHDGIEVLEFARQHQRDAVRVLLTGYLDERAQRALLSPDAPYKVGKHKVDDLLDPSVLHLLKL